MAVPAPSVPPPPKPTTPPPLTPWLPSLLNRLQPAPETVVLILAIVIGGGTGLAVVGFHVLIEAIRSLMLEHFMGVISPLGPWTLACIPAIGGLVVGLMRWFGQDFGPSISALISATQGYRVVPLQASAKAIAAAVSLGTGASLGPEGPSVEIGANVGVLLGQGLQMSQERQRLLLGAGAAAGLAAGFNAPIAGVFFALEVVLGTTFATSAVSVVLLAAVVAALISQIGLGGQPAFTLPSYEVRSPLELPLYLGLGLFASLVSVAYTQAIQLTRQGFQGKLPRLAWLGRLPSGLQPALGGLLVGLLALQFPQILGIGYEIIEAILRDVEFSLPLLITLLLVKLGTTAISLGSGLVGGLFAPAMFLGAALGAAYGKLLPVSLPWLAESIAAPPAYAMVGMAAVLAASARAPLTSILLLFEMTRDYRIILPLMAAVGLSVWLMDSLQPVAHTVSTSESTGLSLNAGSEQPPDLLQHLIVAQAMHHDVLQLPGSLPILQAGSSMTSQGVRSALVTDEAGKLMGIVTLQDINRVIGRWQKSKPVHAEADTSVTPMLNQRLIDICTRDVLSAYEDETLAEAMTRMAARGLRQLPVVKRDQPQQIVGLLEENRINLVCSIAMTQDLIHPFLSQTPKIEPLGVSPAQRKSA
jgi:H+/Cl- antiporter ClcA/CBS domain-containing protein